MSIALLEKYRNLYSEYITHAVKLHNSHMLFCKLPSYEGGLQIRKALRNMMKLEREMLRTNLKAVYEYEKHVKDLDRQAKRLAKAEEKKKRRKYVRHNKTTSDNV